jgi:hypothetical protein
MNASRCIGLVSGGLAAILFAGCGGPKQSPATVQYLHRALGVMGELDADLAKGANPAAPVEPDMSKLSRAMQTDALNRYAAQLKPYYESVRKNVDGAMAACNAAQAKWSGVDVKDVDTEASDLQGKLSVIINHRVQLAVNMEALVDEWNDALSDGSVPKYAANVIHAGLDALLAPDASLAGLAELQPNASEQAELSQQGRDVLKAVSALKEEAASAAAARTALAAALKTRYPADDWAFLAR